VISGWRVLAVAEKETRTVLRDGYVIKALILQPVILTVIFAFAVKTELREAPWEVYDADQTRLSRELVEQVVASGQVALPGHPRSYDDLEDQFRRGSACVAIVIPPGFTRALERGESSRVQLIQNGADTFSALRLSSTITDVAQRFTARDLASTRELRPREPGEPAIVLQRSFRFNPRRDDIWFFGPTIPAIFLTQLFLGVACFAIAGERERRTYEHLLALPLRPPEIIIGKGIPFFALGYGIGAIYFLVFSPLVLGISVRGSLLGLAGATFLFFFDLYVIAALFSGVVQNVQQAVYFTVFSVLPSTVISGFLVPTTTMPKVIQWAAVGLPTTHYVTLLRGIVVRGAPLDELAEPLVSLGIIGAVALVLLLVFFPRRVA
jgi:ABC-2 type transport system permease protein